MKRVLQKNVLTLNQNNISATFLDLKHFSLKIDKYIFRISKFHHKQFIKRAAMMKNIKMNRTLKSI